MFIITELFHTSINSSSRKRPFVPKHLKQKDAKRRKVDKSDSHDGKKKFNKSDNEKKGFKPKAGTETSKKSTANASTKKLKMKSKPKKTKGKKKTNRNKNK